MTTGLGSLERIGAAACSSGGPLDRGRRSRILADLEGDRREGLCGRSVYLPLGVSPLAWAGLPLGLGAWENRGCGLTAGEALGVGT